MNEATLQQSLELAIQHHTQGRWPEAEDIYRQILHTDPVQPDALHLLGVMACQKGDNDAAVDLISKALGQRPDFAEAHSNLGNALKDLGRMEDAVASYQQALAIQPEFADALNNLGAALTELGRPGDAVGNLQKALAIQPGFASAHYNLGDALKQLGQMDGAVARYQKALVLEPDYAEALSNLGAALTELGRLDDAVESLEKALALKPDYTAAGKNLLYAKLNVPGLTAAALYAEHRRFAETQAQGIVPLAEDFSNDTDPDRKLRIGYLSSDFRNHPVGMILLPLLTGHDHARVEIFCYADVPQPDAMTERFRALADHWRPTSAISDAEVAQMVRADGIDVLVSLAGHFDRNRPLVSAYRAAPVQVSYHDGATSGLGEMDYWLSDDFLHPADTKEQFTERLHRLPVFYQWPPIEDAPAVGPLPADKAGLITFGSFNNPAKINGDVIRRWAEILQSVPDSQLLLKYMNWFGQASLQDHLIGQFEAAGVTPDRVRFDAMPDTLPEHLGRYADVDIALDPFPFNGATTTFQALWMGVPVVSLAGETFISRAAGSILQPAGLGDLAVDAPDAYVATARDLAADRTRLRTLRSSLRDRIAASAMCDAAAYARSIEAAYRQMWAAWCAGSNSGP